MISRLFLTIPKYLFLWAYDLGVIPNYIIPTNILARLKSRAIFKNRKISINRRGFYYLDPMPSINELNTYYENIYWQYRGKDEGVIGRDFDHYMLIRSLAPDFFNQKITILNFGAGHGGISHLLFLSGHKVINVEPSGLSLDYKSENWLNYKSIDEVSDAVDLIYGSHSLEHVHDLNEVEGFFLNILKSGGYIFLEVPNGSVESNGGCNGKLVVPHTYYFTDKYFDSLPFETILNRNYDSKIFPSIPSSGGDVIRYLGKRES